MSSDLRQIPDNQEVYLSSDSETSIVVEILQMVEEGQCSTDLWEAVKYVFPQENADSRFHFDSLAHDNTALSSTILTSPPSSPINSSPLEGNAQPKPVTLIGTQKIHKFTHNPTGAPRPGHEDEEPDQVWIGMALWRCWMGKKKADVVLSVNVNMGAEGGEAEKEKVAAWLENTVSSFRIEDWGLFGDSDE
jgi:hypothetical protein